MNNVADFQSFLVARGCKSSTIRNHLYSITRIRRLASGLAPEAVLQALLKLKEQGKRGRYLNNLVNSLRLWGQWQNVPELTTLLFFKEEPFIKATMTDEEIESFLGLACATCRHVSRRGKETMRPSDPKRWDKMRVFWSICAFTGMRPGEVAHLTVDAVDWGRGVFILEDTKTNEPRFVPIPPNITALLHEYIDKYVKDANYLFPSPRGGNHNGVGPVIDNADWHYDFHRRLKRLGILRKNLTPYSLRHSLITRLLEEDVNIFKVQKIVGHQRLETTAQYTHLTTKDMQRAIMKHPLILKSLDPQRVLEAIKEFVRAQNLDKNTFEIVETNMSIAVELKMPETP